MRLLRTEKPETRIEKALREIESEHVKSKWQPVDPVVTARCINVDDVLSKSVRKTDEELSVRKVDGE